MFNTQSRQAQVDWLSCTHPIKHLLNIVKREMGSSWERSVKKPYRETGTGAKKKKKKKKCESIFRKVERIEFHQPLLASHLLICWQVVNSRPLQFLSSFSFFLFMPFACQQLSCKLWHCQARARGQSSSCHYLMGAAITSLLLPCWGEEGQEVGLCQKWKRKL